MPEPRSAGVLLEALETGRVLLLLRSLEGGSAATWSVPGGRVEEGESLLEAATRELAEETGYERPFERTSGHTVLSETFALFFGQVPEEFEVELDHEHIDAGWFDPSDPPWPLHPGGLAEILDEC